MNMDTTPLEAGLDYFIKFDKVRAWDSISDFPSAIDLLLFADKNPYTF